MVNAHAPVVVVGGSGVVGSMVLPHLAQRHRLRVYDLRPPTADVAGVTYVPGDVTDPEQLSEALAGAGALVYMAMGPHDETGGDVRYDTAQPALVAAHVDVNVKGLYLALRAAAAHGLPRAVFTSTMSVYREPRDTYPDEDVPPDATAYYGLTKRLGEQVCQAVVAETGLGVVALRLCRPVPDDPWPPAGDPGVATSARDTARAIRAGLEYPGGGFVVAAINGDRDQRRVPIERARRLLGWEPSAG